MSWPQAVNRGDFGILHAIMNSTSEALNSTGGNNGMAGSIMDEDQIGSDLNYKFTCADKTYPDAARRAFSPLMGFQWFPPWLEMTTVHSCSLSQTLVLYCIEPADLNASLAS